MTKPLDWKEEFKELLARIRANPEQLNLEDMDADLCEMAVYETVKEVLCAAGLRMVELNQYRWFLRELSKVLRLYIGWDLAYHIEELLRKWVGYRLNFSLMQLLVVEAYTHLAVPAASAPEPEVEHARP